MTTLLRKHYNELEALDLMFKNLFNSDSFFAPVVETKISHPVDVYQSSEGLHLEVACTGLDKSDIEINVEGDILKISYNKKEEPQLAGDDEKRWLHKGIARRSFSLGYKVATKYDLSKIDATMANGLLSILVPYAEESKPVSVTIK